MMKFLCINHSVSKVCVARWNSQTFRDTLLTQDLVHGEGQTVSMGDTVELVLSSWLLQNHAIGQVFFCLQIFGFVCQSSSFPFPLLAITFCFHAGKTFYLLILPYLFFLGHKLLFNLFAAYTVYEYVLCNK